MRYVKPPDYLATQLDVYTEEKYDDEEDLRNRARAAFQSAHEPQSDSDNVLSDIIRLAKQHGELYPMMVDILTHYGEILQKDIGLCVPLPFQHYNCR